MAGFIVLMVMIFLVPRLDFAAPPAFIAGGHEKDTLRLRFRGRPPPALSGEVQLHTDDETAGRGSEPRDAARVEIVDFRPEHADAFRQMNLDWINHYWEIEEADLLYLDHPQEKILAPGGAILMALHEGEAVGAVALIPMGGGSYELAKMAVDERARGKGIGWRLGTALLDRARDLGANRVYLESNTILEPAINLYRKLGFEPVQGGVSPYDRCNIQMETWLT